MANINRVPFNEIPPEEAFHKDRGPLWQKLFNIVNQTRTRVGGDDDLLVSISTDVANTELTINEFLVQLDDQDNEIQTQMAALEAKVRHLEKQIKHLTAEITANG